MSKIVFASYQKASVFNVLHLLLQSSTQNQSVHIDLETFQRPLIHLRISGLFHAIRVLNSSTERVTYSRTYLFHNRHRTINMLHHFVADTAEHHFLKRI